MANIIQKWRKIVACGCSHGELANKGIQKQILDFCKSYKPDIRVDLGDIVDTAAFRSGARGTPDEARKIEPDEFSAISWMDRYAPNYLLFGNHDHRLLELQNSPNAIVSYAAAKLWTQITDKARELHCKTKMYDYEHGAFLIGGTHFIHGFMYGQHAVRDHAEYFGGPVVMAHLHAAQQVSGRTRTPSSSYCVGCVADIESLHYARRRRNTSTWSHGCVVGEVSDKSSHLWLASCDKGGSLRFPF